MMAVISRPASPVNQIAAALLSRHFYSHEYQDARNDKEIFLFPAHSRQQPISANTGVCDQGMSATGGFSRSSEPRLVS